MPALGSEWTQGGFVILSLLMIVAFVVVVARYCDGRRAVIFGAGAVVWSALVYALANAGVLAHFGLPPRMLFVLLGGLALLVVIMRSSIGAALVAAPQALLIGLQSFRVVVELLIHQAVSEGTAPPQMTWSGYNLDMLSGLSAPIVALLASRGVLGRGALLGWNFAAIGLLAVVVSVGVLSMPTPLQQMEPDNTWIAYPPYVLLPAVLVMSALLLHAASIKQLLGRNS